MSKLKTLTFILVFVHLVGCRSSQNGTVSNISEMVEKSIGSEYKSQERGKYMLYHSMAKPGEVRKKMLVLDQEKMEIIYGPEVVNADVSWYSDVEILLEEKRKILIKANYK